MPAPTVRVPYSEFLDRNARHAQIAQELPNLGPALQKALAELLLIRLFDDFQDAIAGIAYRLACEAPYLDATAPTLLIPAAKSSESARYLFETHNRNKHRYVKWSKATYIKDTVRHVLDASDPFITAVDAYSLEISEMQAVRNRIAHRNTNSRKAFDPVLRRYYGGAPTNVTPGLLLITGRVTPTPLTRYLTATRVILRDCVRA